MTKISHSEAYWLTAPVHVVRCSARYKDGQPCRREAAPGGNVCGQHGGSVPQVIAAAQTRIAMSADEAAKWLVDWMNDTAVDQRERLKAAESLLDRAGVAGAQKHLLSLAQQDPVEQLFQRLLADPEGLASPAEELPALPPADDYLVGAEDAEVVAEPVAREVEPPQRPVTPPHIRRALDDLL